MNESDIASIDRILDEIAELEAAAERRDDPNAGWEYNLAVEQFGHVMANAAPRLLALARRGMEADAAIAAARQEERQLCMRTAAVAAAALQERDDGSGQ